MEKGVSMKKSVLLHSVAVLTLASSIVLTPLAAIAETPVASESSTAVSSVPEATTTESSTADGVQASTDASSTEETETSSTETTTEVSSSSTATDPLSSTVPSSTSTETSVTSSTTSTESTSTTASSSVTAPSLIVPEAAKIESENSGVYPIQLKLLEASYGEVIAGVDVKAPGAPRYLTTMFDVVDIKGRLMFQSKNFTIFKTISSKSFSVRYFPDGIYTVIVHGQAAASDGGKSFLGRMAFKVANRKVVGAVAVPASTSGLTAPLDYVGNGVNPIHLDSSGSYGTIVEFYGKIDWLPYAYQNASLTVYNMSRKVMATTDKYSFDGRMHAYTSVYVTDYPDGIYVAEAKGTTDSRNGNQQFIGRVAFKVQNRRFAGVEAVPSSFANDGSSTTEATPVYRLYNPSRKAYLFTQNTTEIRGLIASGQWKNEGIAWKTAATGTPVYRLYHPTQKVHFYTRNYSEYVKLAGRGWKQEGIAYRSAGSVVIYRLYNAKTKKYFFTKNASERDLLASRGWTNEGIGWYGMP